MSTVARLRPLLLLSGLLVSPVPEPAFEPQGQAIELVTSLNHPKLSGLRRAAAVWDLQLGPTRLVVDQVCLVPDVATFYEALAAWDEGHYFPILIDDADLCLKFLAAFRPARIVRYPGRAKPLDREQAWDRAVAAVGEAWTTVGATAAEGLRGDRRPSMLGKTPQGIVLGRPASASLPGLAALAAGRFQPLARLDSKYGYNDALAPSEMRAFDQAVQRVIRERLPAFESLGDDCDFIALAGDYPYRYSGPGGSLAVDDRLGRSDPSFDRWAFTGRLMGDARRSVYAAMCSLFLRPDRALLFNSYSDTEPGFSAYTLKTAEKRLRSLVPVTMVSGEKSATIQGWHDLFNPINRFGFLMINTRGGPGYFERPGGAGHALDAMPSAPAAVCMIHSFSAADPTDEKTIAGRWLAQGAFLYHGSMDEPQLPAFRLPTLVSEMLAEGVPFGAALRPLPTEIVKPFGDPWKLVLLGDPLYRLRSRGTAPARAQDFAATASWPVYSEPPPPKPDAPESTRLGWAVKASLVRQTSASSRGPEEVIAVLRSIDRGRLDRGVRGILDELTMRLMYSHDRLDDLLAVYRAIPSGERSALTRRLALSAVLAAFHRSLGIRDFDRATALWVELISLEPDIFFKARITPRVGPLADTPSRRENWRRILRAAANPLDNSEAGGPVAEELKRVERAVAADRGH
jgi:hypothetical protein